MSPLANLTHEAVLAAVEEFERLGRDKFLKQYGFGRARTYALLHNGKLYDPKAIAGVAHQFATGRLATAREFSGGIAAGQVGRAFERLGLTMIAGEIETCQRPGCWGRAEWLADYLICDSCLADGSAHVHDQQITCKFREAYDISTVDLEAQNVTTFSVPGSSAITGLRRESQLCARYVKFLGRDLKRKRIKIPGELSFMFTDPYDETEHELYESKANADRMSIRMGFAQLRDYRRHIERDQPGLKLTIMLPELPSHDLIDFSLGEGLDIVFEEPSGKFARLAS